MTPDRVPAPVEALVRAIAGGGDDDDDRRATTFARGLALGALVGAAIAGSTIWQRRHGRLAGARPLRPSTAQPAPGAATPTADGPDRAPGAAGLAPDAILDLTPGSIAPPDPGAPPAS
jgi:hypothetical protein